MLSLLKKWPVRTAAAALSGTLLFLACADFDIWPLAWFAMVPLLWVILDDDCQQPFFYGFVTGLLANGGGFYWIDGLLRRFGHLPAVASLPIFALLIAYQALAFGLFAWALRRLRDHTPLAVVWLAPLVMTSVELIVPFLFPWYLAITQAWNVPVIQIAELTGPLGVSFLLVLSNGAFYELVRAWAGGQGRRIAWRRAGVAACIIASCLVYGLIRIHQVEAKWQAAPKVKVGLVQANIGINEKWVPGLREQNLKEHQELSADLERRGADLIVWPESSYSYAIERDRTTDFDDMRQAQRGFHKPLLFGALTYGNDSRYPFNSALMMDENGHFTGRFDKNFLLVFGEYIPYYERLSFLQKLIPEMSNFARGSTVTTFPFGRWRLGPMICYEDIIPSFGRRLVAKKPNLLVNITNDAWFGATSEPYEHMALSVFRAVEHRLDMVRAVNTGTSVFIDATGRVKQISPAVDPVETPGVKPATLLGEVAMLDASGPYGTLGDAFGFACLLAVLFLAVLGLRRAGRPLAMLEIGWAMAVISSVIFLVVLVGFGPGQFSQALSLLLHSNPEQETDYLVLGASLVMADAFSCMLAGWWLARRSRKRPRSMPWLEAGVAAVALLVVPALALGRTEGATASLVFTALGGLGMAWLGARLSVRRGRVDTSPGKTTKQRK